MIAGRRPGRILGGRKQRRNFKPVEDTRSEEEKSADSRMDWIIGSFCLVVLIVVILAMSGAFAG